MKVCFQAHLSGNVQGVFFRASTQQQAIELGISGYAHNLPNGDVEVVMCGQPDDINTLLKWLEHGPENADVENIESKQIPLKEFNHFSIG